MVNFEKLTVEGFSGTIKLKFNSISILVEVERNKSKSCGSLFFSGWKQLQSFSVKQQHCLSISHQNDSAITFVQLFIGLLATFTADRVERRTPAAVSM